MGNWRQYCRFGDSSAARGMSLVAASGHEPISVSAGNRLVLPPVSVGTVGRAVDALARLQIDLVGAHAKKQAELAQLRHPRGPPAALPFQLAGTASTNPVLFGLGVFLVLAWKVAGWWGFDRWLLTRLGTPWTRGRVFAARTARLPRPEPLLVPEAAP